MFSNYLKTALRNFLRNKTYSSINTLGLAIGMAVFLLIAQYVKFENSYEDFVPDRANIYRVSLTRLRNNEVISSSAENYPAVGPALRRELPEVTAFARLYNLGYKNNVMITNEQATPDPIVLKQHHFLYADSSFLPMMGYAMLNGKAEQALSQPFSAVISEKYARLWFGSADPLGKTLHMHDDDFNDELVKVTGVFKDLPANTHLKFDVLFSYSTLLARPYGNPHQRFDKSWDRADMYTFVRLRPGVDPTTMAAKLPAIVDKYKPGLRAGGSRELLQLQPLSSIHLHSDLAEEPELNGNANIVFFLGIIGIFVLVIAWINFVNLSTARAMTRAREVGVRKVIGASRIQLFLRFIMEAALTNGLALLIACALLFPILPAFNTISGLPLDASDLTHPWFMALLGLLWIGGTIAAGFYPAMVLSAFRPAAVLKGRLRTNAGGGFLRRALVVGQFMASIALITGTMIIYRQLHFMMHSDLGMNIDQVVVMDRPGIQPSDRTNAHSFRSEIDLFRNGIKRTPDMEAVSNTTTIPGMLREWRYTVKRWGGHTNDSVLMRTGNIDYDFLKVFKMQLLAGRNFSPDYPHDPDTSAILTASAARLLGFKNPGDAIARTIVIPEWNNQKKIVVGVVNDFHQYSLKRPLEPTLFTCDLYESEFYAVRVHTSNMSASLGHIRAAWNKAFPGNPFEYFFLDEYFNRQYANERRFGELFTTFAVLAILISCLGLFGLSSYMASQRVKEIGVRKVLGASVANITAMLSSDFLRLVLISLLIATPLTWMTMHGWLQSYAYRTSIPWWIFAAGGFIAIAIALVTVSFQAVRAALANPVDSLRSE
ncbi:MAG: ABC transporter permease [Bacteroidetes bacterium]|nr:ABC transporter permease [Bacteroidota bacterium]